MKSPTVSTAIHPNFFNPMKICRTKMNRGSQKKAVPFHLLNHRTMRSSKWHSGPEGGQKWITSLIGKNNKRMIHSGKNKGLTTSETLMMGMPIQNSIAKVARAEIYSIVILGPQNLNMTTSSRRKKNFKTITKIKQRKKRKRQNLWKKLMPNQQLQKLSQKLINQKKQKKLETAIFINFSPKNNFSEKQPTHSTKTGYLWRNWSALRQKKRTSQESRSMWMEISWFTMTKYERTGNGDQL